MQYWQQFVPASCAPDGTVWARDFAAAMPDGTRLLLPLRDLGARAVAGLIANQASFAVLDQLSAWLTAVARRHVPEVVVGLPTLGHVFGAAVARGLGHAGWVAPSMTRKLWYDEALSEPVASITSPGAGRRMWLDPRLLDRLRGRRVLLIDDVISTGASLRAGLALLARADIAPVAACACMLQGDAWDLALPNALPIEAVFATPLFSRAPAGASNQAGWKPLDDTACLDRCPLLWRT